MKIVKVFYTTKAEFVDPNRVNVQSVMNNLKKLDPPGIFYHVCLGADGKTFTHTAFFQSADDQKVLFELPVFKYFQEQLSPDRLEVSPKQEILTLIGSSREILRTI